MKEVNEWGPRTSGTLCLQLEQRHVLKQEERDNQSVDVSML